MELNVLQLLQLLVLVKKELQINVHSMLTQITQQIVSIILQLYLHPKEHVKQKLVIKIFQQQLILHVILG